ncbi:MAG: methyltransferase domain-containing protein [Chitinispirillaceae bacterium]
MIKYYLTGSVLKLFSCCAASRAIYRCIGNAVGARKRKKGRIPQYYINRVKQLLEDNRKFGFLRDGAKVLELGTGWLHWEAIAARLFYDIEATLFDVWDNRQLSGMKHYVSQLQMHLPNLGISKEQIERAEVLIRKITKVESFQELYDLLGFTYVLEPDGRMDSVEKDYYDVVISAGVMEHIKISTLPLMLKSINEVLKPGGLSIHHINLMDHIRAYSKSASCKQYLTYSESHWRRFLQNEVQYINRLQRPEWLELFREAGLELVRERCSRQEIFPLEISEQFRVFSLPDLNVATINLIHMRPADVAIPNLSLSPEAMKNDDFSPEKQPKPASGS